MDALKRDDFYGEIANELDSKKQKEVIKGMKHIKKMSD